MSKELVDAIQDLTRVTIALHGKFETRAEAVRRLSELSIPPPRIAAILAMDIKKVHTVLSRAKKTKQQVDGASEGEGDGEA